MAKKVRMLTIKNWSEFQHYKKRCPPWIKLHWAMLSSEDWSVLSDTDRLILIVCLMIGSQFDGRIPDDPDYIKRVAYLRRKPNLKPLIDCGFLIEPQADASGTLADASTLQANACPEQSRAEQSREDRPNGRDAEHDSPMPPSGSSTEERFWALEADAKKVGIGKGSMGKLINNVATDPEDALSILRKAMAARKPSDYLGGVFKRHKEDTEGKKAAASGTPSDEPEIIRSMRLEGVTVERIKNATTGKPEWHAQGRYYNEQGEEIGW